MMSGLAALILKGVSKLDITIRNNYLVKYNNLIWWTIHQNRQLINALRLEEDDVYQDLVIAAIKALDNFNPAKSNSLFTHVAAKLQYEILHIKTRNKPHGVTGLKGKSVTFLSVERHYKNGQPMEISVEVDFGEAEISDAFAQLDSEEETVLRMHMDGECIRRKQQRESLLAAQEKLQNFYGRSLVACC